MRNFKTILFIAALLITVSCTVAAKDKTTTDKASQGKVITLNKTEFLTKVFNYEKSPNEWIYEGDKPCIIDFYADWCPPCKKIAPILKELAADYKEEIIIYKVNIDNEQELKALFGIQSIPSLLFVPAKGQPQMAQGALPKEIFVEQIDQFLLGK